MNDESLKRIEFNAYERTEKRDSPISSVSMNFKYYKEQRTDVIAKAIEIFVNEILLSGKTSNGIEIRVNIVEGIKV